MQVPENSIYGFLGSNGAGKSTTIRNVLGLLRPQNGQIELFGEDLKQQKQAQFKRVGALIETPALYPNLSAHDQLRIACRYQQIAEERIPLVLEQVGLLAQQHKISKKYSTGMKQRLGLAIALLHEPELLILDEPTNGLDPQGISDIRQLIQQLRQSGKTILLSSHLLAEIEKIATHVGIIKDGHLLFEGDRMALDEWKKSQQQLKIQVNNPQALTQLLDAERIVDQQENHLHIKAPVKSEIPDLIRLIIAAGIDIYEVKLIENDLEQLFMELNQE